MKQVDNCPLPDRRLVAAGLVAALLAAPAVTAQTDAAEAPPQVLFICEAGTVKSAMAREYLRRRAMERGIPVAVASRGIEPADHVSAKLRAALAADAVDTASDPLRRLVSSDVANADVVVFFNRPEAIALPATALDWSSVGSMNEDFPAARTDLLKRIDALLDTIRRNGN